jgi:hypothetical protein
MPASPVNATKRPVALIAMGSPSSGPSVMGAVRLTGIGGDRKKSCSAGQG